MHKIREWFPVALAFAAFGGPVSAADASVGWIGVAREDITPTYPIRLTGYAARSGMSTGVVQRLWAKALAFGEGPGTSGARVLVTVDNCGVSARITEAVAARIARAGVAREHFVVASSHTHSAPMVRGFAENIFVRDLNPEELAASDRYTGELTDALERVVLAALKDRQPGGLWQGRGTVGFAANRRTPGGPVDHALPLLVARDAGGRVKAVVANYACHCTTLGHQVNGHHGDWAGYAQEAIEADHPGAVALISIGCGADANPHPRGGDDFGIAHARSHGRALADAAGRVLSAGGLEPLPSRCGGRLNRLVLPFAPLPDRTEWERRAGQDGIVGYHARKNLARLDRGESLPTTLDYPVQTWSFGDRFAMVFLAGEVVVDYALRLKSELAGDRLWITAYANDVPCYIPSRRILAEGGYEAETSLWYYDRPARLSPAVEDQIVGEVASQLGSGYARAGGGAAEGR